MATTRYIVNNLSGQTIPGINSTTIISDTISATTISGGTFYGDGSNLSGISTTDYYVTGFTYSNNTFTIVDNSGSTFDASFNDVTGLTVNGNLTITGNTLVQELTANTISATTISGGTFYGDGSNLTGINGISTTTGSWTLSAGANTVSFTVTAGESYVMWVNGNIPNGIVNWNATVTLSNSNVPAIGVQYGWYYLVGNALVLTSIPSQIVGTAGSIVTTSPAVSNSNTFTFGITNNSGVSQIIYYGYIKIS
jgi:hypothetical protein